MWRSSVRDNGGQGEGKPVNRLRKMYEVETAKSGGREYPSVRTVQKKEQSPRGTLRVIREIAEEQGGSSVRKQGPWQVSKQAVASRVECSKGLKMKSSGDSIVTGLRDSLGRGRSSTAAVW